MIPEAGEVGAHSQKKHVQIDAICNYSTVIMSPELSNEHPIESESPVSERIFKIILNTAEVTPMKGDTTGDVSNLDNAQLMTLDTAVSRVDATVEIAEQSVPVHPCESNIFLLLCATKR